MKSKIAGTTIEINLELVNVGQINITSPNPAWLTSVHRMIEGYSRGVSLEGGEKPSFSANLSSVNILVLQGNTLQVTIVLHELAIINDSQRDELLTEVGRKAVQEVVDKIQSRENRDSFIDTVRHITGTSVPTSAV